MPDTDRVGPCHDTRLNVSKLSRHFSVVTDQIKEILSSPTKELL